MMQIQINMAYIIFVLPKKVSIGSLIPEWNRKNIKLYMTFFAMNFFLKSILILKRV
jgi:hypothetical protein